MASSRAYAALVWVLAAAAAVVLAAFVWLASHRPREAPIVRPPTPAPPATITLQEKFDELALREKQSPQAYAGFWRAYSALLPEARGTPLERTIVDKLETLDTAARRA